MSGNVVRLRVLGGVRVEIGGYRSAGAATQRKSLALLALLAAARQAGVSRESIGAYLWPEAEAARVSHRLNQLLYALRRDLGRDDLFLGSADVRLNSEAITTDLREFLDALVTGRLEEAASLYGGPFLEGFHLDDAPEFERWADGQRGDLERQYRAALDSLGSQAMKEGDASGAAEWLRRRFQMDPLDAGSALRLMEALRAAGGTFEALQVARDHAVSVRQELGTDPDPRVAQFAERVRDGPKVAAPADGGLIPPANGEGDGPTLRIPAAEQLSLPREPPPTVPQSAGAETEAAHPAAAAPPHYPRSKRVVVTIAQSAVVLFGLVGIVTVVAPHRPSQADSKRVMVTVFENRTGDSTLAALGRIASDWISRGLSQTGFVEVLDPSVSAALIPAPTGVGGAPDLGDPTRALAARTRAGTLVVGSYYAQGDSLYFDAKIIDLVGQRLISAVPPVGGPSSRPLTAVDALRRKVMGALAFRFDPRLRDLPIASEPPTYEGYRHYVEGVSLHMKGDFQGAIGELTLAAASDSTFRVPLIIAASSHFFLGDYAAADSLVQLVGRHREHLMPLEDYTLRWLEAKLAGDEMKALEMTRESSRLAPGTITQLGAAIDALTVNRPREALAALTTMDPEQGVLRESGFLYWWALATAHHMLGDHTEELRVAEEARKRYGDTWDTIFLEMRALAALGRTSDVRTRLDESAGVGRGKFWESELALILVGQDLRAHGYAEAAQDVFVRAVAMCRALPVGAQGRESNELQLAYALYLAEDWEGARQIAAKAAAADTTHWYPRAILARIAARRGDVATAEHLSQALASVRRPYLFGSVTLARADIAALLGKRDDSVTLLRQALAEGFPFVYELHIDTDFEPLRGYPPFEELLQPRD